MSWSQLAHLGAVLVSRFGRRSQGRIGNAATCSRALIQSVLRLRQGTIGQQLHAVLDGIERLLAQHALVEQEGARVRLIAFGPQAVELELFAYITTSDYRTFLKIRQSLLLQITSIVESLGSGFAGPTPFIHLTGER